MTFAVEPIGVIFPPNPTQNMSAHQRSSVPIIPSASKNAIMGSIAMVMGILSRIEERIALPQRIISAVSIIFFSTPPAILSAKKLRTPAASRPQTSTKREIKKRKTESSIFLRYFCGLSCGATSKRRVEAHASATSAGGR